MVESMGGNSQPRVPERPAIVSPSVRPIHAWHISQKQFDRIEERFDQTLQKEGRYLPDINPFGARAIAEVKASGARVVSFDSVLPTNTREALFLIPGNPFLWKDEKPLHMIGGDVRSSAKITGAESDRDLLQIQNAINQFYEKIDPRTRVSSLQEEGKKFKAALLKRVAFYRTMLLIDKNPLEAVRSAILAQKTIDVQQSLISQNKVDGGEPLVSVVGSHHFRPNVWDNGRIRTRVMQKFFTDITKHIQRSLQASGQPVDSEKIISGLQEVFARAKVWEIGESPTELTPASVVEAIQESELVSPAIAEQIRATVSSLIPQ